MTCQTYLDAADAGIFGFFGGSNSNFPTALTSVPKANLNALQSQIETTIDGLNADPQSGMFNAMQQMKQATKDEKGKPKTGKMLELAVDKKAVDSSYATYQEAVTTAIQKKLMNTYEVPTKNQNPTLDMFLNEMVLPHVQKQMSKSAKEFVPSKSATDYTKKLLKQNPGVKEINSGNEFKKMITYGQNSIGEIARSAIPKLSVGAVAMSALKLAGEVASGSAALDIGMAAAPYLLSVVS